MTGVLAGLGALTRAAFMAGVSDGVVGGWAMGIFQGTLRNHGRSQVPAVDAVYFDVRSYTLQHISLLDPAEEKDSLSSEAVGSRR